MDRWLIGSVTATALLLPLSIALVQPAAYLAAALGLWIVVRGEGAGKFPFRRVILFFLAAVVLASVLGERPLHALSKSNRFLLLFTLAAISWAALRSGRRDAAERWAGWFMLGLGLKAAYDLVRIPVEMSFGTPLYFTGNMSDPQFYLVGVLLTAGLLIGGRWSLRYPPVTAGLLLALSGLVLHFKRGAWMACLAGLVVVAFTARRTRPLAVAVLLLAALFMVPSVQERVMDLQREWAPESGGRLVLWTEVAPVLFEKHPWGMGWKSVRNEDFIAVSDRVEPGLNHLHNNLLQVRLELGWIGLAAWVMWMGSVWICLFRAARCTSGGKGDGGLALGLLGAFSGLMINGLVEYNFGDSEVFLLMIFLIGLSAAACQARARAIAEH
jgi:O-antigen ligase